MNHFSDKEYQNLRVDTAEIRQCITRYIGYVISVTGFSGILKYLFEFAREPRANILILSFSLIITTLLFEIIWYKFKSHNRYVGYCQLLMQEIDAIPKVSEKDNFELSEDEIDNKDYIRYYKKYIAKKYDKGIKDFYSWEFVVSRLHGNYFSEIKNDNLEKALKQSIANTEFVFTVSDSLYPFIEIDHHDEKFFNKIVFPIYLQSKPKNFFTRILCYITFLFKTDSKIVLNKMRIEKRYLVNGWRYPKKITQIGFVTASITYGYFLYSFFKTFEFNDNFSFNWNWDSVLATILLLVTTIVYGYWIYKFMFRLKDLIYGKDSIDFYCWMFFVFRVQLLNNKGVIPVFFSRAFIRYFKTNLYNRILVKNKDAFFSSIANWVTEKELVEYQHALNEHLDFDAKQRKIHNVLKECFKEKRTKLAKRPDNLKIDSGEFQDFAENIFSDHVLLTEEQKIQGMVNNDEKLITEIISEFEKDLKKKKYLSGIKSFFVCDD